MTIARNIYIITNLLQVLFKIKNYDILTNVKITFLIVYIVYITIWVVTWIEKILHFS